jgi:phosphoglycerol transferase
MCIAIGSLGVYYATFTVLLVGVAALVTAATGWSWRPIVQGAVVVLLIGGMSFVNDIPAALYRHQHGVDEQVAHRLPAESELYALKLVEMVLPVPGHRIGAFSRLRARYDTTTPVPSEDAQQSLGIVASLGLVWMLLVGLAAIAGTDRRTLWLRRTRQLAFATLTAFLIGTMGGFSAVLAYLVAAQIRGWDRISIFIAFFAIASVGLAVDALGRRVLASRRFRSTTGFLSRGRLLLLGGLALLLAVGIYDQSSYEAIPPYALNSLAYGDDGLFVHAIQRIMPRNAMIFQLPYMAFPETPPVGNIQDYDPGRGYVHTTDGLRWSYGAMNGRPQDWEVDTPGVPTATLLDGVVAAGFSGLWIDTLGYQDGAAALRSQVQQVLHSQPLISRDGRFLFYDLRPLAAKLRRTDPRAELSALSAALLHPPTVTFGNGFYPLDTNNARWALPTAQASIANSTSHSQVMVFSATVQTRAPGHWKLTMTAPNGATTHFAIGPKPRAIRFEFIDPPGTHNLTLTTKAPVVPAIADPRQLAVYYTDPVIQRGAFSPFLPGLLKTSFNR